MNFFLSYRRDDSAAITGRIYDRLTAKFGRDAVFMDVDAIPLGIDFRDHIREAVSQCDAFLAVIDNLWNGSPDTNERRLDNPSDFVRVELETAMALDIPIIPILIGQTSMPRPSELPASLEAFAYRNAGRVDVGRDFHAHMDRIIDHLDKGIRMKPSVESTSPAPDVHAYTTQFTGAPPALILLEMESSSSEGGRYSFDASKDRRIIIGRHPECDLPLDEKGASRKHAMILYDLTYGWILQDLASRGGVYLNGNRTEKAGLNVGDRIRIGETEIKVVNIWGTLGAAWNHDR